MMMILKSIFFLVIIVGSANAHRSGCHRWHSCPSDSGSYVCGDKGKCSQCPDNRYCKGGIVSRGNSKIITLKPKKFNSANYNRKNFPHWVDTDKDCQDTRAELLIAGSLSKVKFKRNKACVVSWGKWESQFTGKIFTKANDLDIDHVIPLKWAHDHGASSWSRVKRREFANDRMNLLIVEKGLNRSKGAKAIYEWVPMNHKRACEYQSKWRSLIKKYGFKIDKVKIDKSVLGC